MIIKRFRLQGFKSFAEATEVLVGTGMTGIVGPNGCGKSNLIEALRWGVGETSFKSMRAENGMEDLIFAGTQTRPPRNSAEVSITLDNSARLAPVEFNNADTLEVSRRMERGEGSSYRVNGRPALARDVQVLFKDAGFGAKSSAIVSQGKVAAIINSKPLERRSILDEAAGTAGLATRRHEAEIRLRGTEQNLEKAEALEKGLSDQLSSLRRQARQAARRREIDGLVRRAEAAAFLVRWKAIEAKLTSSAEEHAANEETIKDLMIRLSQASSLLAQLEAAAAPLAKARSDAETNAALARVSVDSIRREASAARSALQSAQKNAARIMKDLERERAFLAESDDEYRDLKDQLEMTEEDRQYDVTLIEEASDALEEARAVSEARREQLEAASSELIRFTTELRAAARAVEDAKNAETALAARRETLRSKRTALAADLDALPPEPNDVRELEDAIGVLEEAVSTAAASATDARVRDDEGKGSLEVARQELRLLQAELKSLKAARTERGLATVVQAEPGYEDAAVLALRDGLSAAIGDGGSGEDHWAGSRARSVPPAGTEPLRAQVRIPEELEAALSGVGLATEAQDGETLCAALQPGQSVVFPDGTLRRWDGLVVSSAGAAADDIRRAQRIRQLEHLEATASELCASLARTAEEASAVLKAESEAERRLREELRSRREQLELSIRQNKEAIRRRSEIEAQIMATDEAVRNAELDAAAAAERVAVAERLLSESGSPAPREAEVSAIRRNHSEAVGILEQRRNKLDQIRREADGRVLLASSIRQKLSEFDRRLASCRSAIAEHLARQKESEEEIRFHEEAVLVAPDREAEAVERMEEAAELLEAAVAASADTEAKLLDARNAERILDQSLAIRKEGRARILAEMKAHQESSAELTREIGERLSAGPADLHGIAGVGPDEELPAVEACEARVQRLVRERESLGSVNLLADEQLREVETKLGETNKVRDELREAVRRLRDTISKFDRERRERLTEAFAGMDRNFQDLFSRLFRGGQAYLKLSGSEDILEAGLEIYAAPPGKKLQSMSLLSGGEQALTALAMIFAAFLIRPAPVCVLDEVDAALDDANVDRMCSLVAEMSETTRFLVITHRAITMARCNQLYGVTMAERGVSRLTSLDMEAAVAFVESFTPPSGKD